jgi:hypothetical protein
MIIITKNIFKQVFKISKRVLFKKNKKSKRNIAKSNDFISKSLEIILYLLKIFYYLSIIFKFWG